MLKKPSANSPMSWVLFTFNEICRGDPLWSPEKQGKHGGLPLHDSLLKYHFITNPEEPIFSEPM
jgi:hypothetical protein